MGLQGKYTTGSVSGFELDITTSNDANGTFSGTFTIRTGVNQYSINITGHYHFRDSTNDPTLLNFWGMQDNGPSTPGIYVGYAGICFSSQNYSTINGHGGVSMVDPQGNASSTPFGMLTKA